MRQVQRGVFLTSSKKLLYAHSPLKRAYPPDGLTVEKLLTDSHTRRERILTIYRNLIRLSAYLQFHTYMKKVFCELVRVKLRQDYEYRKAILLPGGKIRDVDRTNVDGKDAENAERRLCERLVNTVNFVHNAALDSVANETARPVSMEFKILSSILQYEVSKALPSGLKGKLQDNFISMEKFMEFRQIERSWNMLGVEEGRRENLWWIDNGMMRNEVCFEYLEELKNLKTNQKTFMNKMAGSILDFERYLVFLNEESKLLL